MNPRHAAAASAAVVALATPLVIHFEGEIRHGYRDPIGIVTACVGHTGPESQMGRTYTAAECRALLARDLADHDAGLMTCIGVRQVPDRVHAAFLSFTFNVGVAKACSSTAVAKLKAGDFAGACAELSRWTMAGGRVLAGLVKRRAAERALCEGRPLASLGVAG